MQQTDSKITQKYVELINESEKHLDTILKRGISVPENSWVNEAIEHAKLVEKHRSNNSLEIFTSDNQVRWKTTVSLGNLAEFNLIMSQSDKLSFTSKAQFEKKLKEIIKMPLMVIDENASIGTNLARNTLFELRLAARFAQSDYQTFLYFDHPDLLVKTLGKEYAVECKRVYSEKSYIRLIKDAIDQLKDYSLTSDPSRLGVVAISISRVFHKGDMKLSSSNDQLLNKFTDKEIESFIHKYSERINSMFPQNIPLLILDFSDFAEIDKPYWVNYLYLIGTEEKLEKSIIKDVFKDFKNLIR